MLSKKIRKEELISPYGIIYKVTNLQTKKIYIGQTTKFNKFNSYYGSGTIIMKTINKYGKIFFKKEILGYCYSQEELDECEKECISFFNTQNRIYGYNISEGGKGLSEEAKLKIGQSLKGRQFSEESKLKISNSAKNKKLSDEHKRKIGLAHKGKKMSEENKQAIIKANTGKKCSDEKKEKIRTSNKGVKRSEETKMKCSVAQTGKKLSGETKQKISVAMKNRKNKNEN